MCDCFCTFERERARFKVCTCRTQTEIEVVIVVVNASTFQGLLTTKIAAQIYSKVVLLLELYRNDQLQSLAFVKARPRYSRMIKFNYILLLQLLRSKL